MNEEANSLQCNDCGAVLKDATAAEIHASKTQHVNFSESTEKIQPKTPLTPEEKALKLEELKIKMAQKKQERLAREAKEEKEKEVVRKRTAKEIGLAKELLLEKEMKQAFELKKKEKADDQIARNKIKAQIEQDKKDRIEKVIFK